MSFIKKLLAPPKTIEDWLIVFGAFLVIAIAITFFLFISSIFVAQDFDQLNALDSNFYLLLKISRIEFTVLGIYGFLICVLCIRRIRLEGRNKKYISNLICAISVLILPIVLNVTFYISFPVFLEPYNATSDFVVSRMEKHLASGSLTKEERSKASWVLANEKFKHTGECIEIFNGDGIKVKYTPTKTAIEIRKSYQVIHNRIFSIKESALEWFVFLIFTILVGCIIPIKPKR